MSSAERWGSYIENDVTREKIPMERVGEKFEMVLKTKKLEEGTRKGLKWAEDGGKKFAGMEVDANEAEEEMMRRVDEGKEGEVVFRRRMLERK